MTEKLLTFPSPIPLSYLPRPWGWKSTLFQKSINTNQQRHLYRDNMRGSRNFLSGGGGGGPGSSTYFTVYIQGGPMVLHIFQGVQLVPWGVQMLISIETHITITCDFPGGGGGGSGPPIWIRTWAMWHFGTNLCGLLLSLETPNANRSIVFKLLAKALVRLRRLV